MRTVNLSEKNDIVREFDTCVGILSAFGEGDRQNIALGVVVDCFHTITISERDKP